MPRYIDLSHAISDGLVTYPGLPAPVIDEHLTREASREHYAPGVEFSIGRISMVGNTGTYVDAPFHRYPDGDDPADLKLERLVDLPGLVIRVPDRESIDADVVAGRDLRGKAVLFATGWDRHFGQPEYGVGHPWLTGATARALVDGGAVLVGIDSLNIDDKADIARPVHSALLGAGVPIAEHLANLDRLPDQGFRFTAVPAPVRGIGTWPVRAYATVD